MQSLVEALRTKEFAAKLGDAGGFPDFGEGVEFLPGADGVTDKYREFAALFGEADIAVLSPFKGKEGGVHELNDRLRQALGFMTREPQNGEILMCTRNAPANDDDDDDEDDGVIRARVLLRLLNGMRLIVTAFNNAQITVRRVGSDETATLPYQPHPHGPAETVDWGSSSHGAQVPRLRGGGRHRRHPAKCGAARRKTALHLRRSQLLHRRQPGEKTRRRHGRARPTSSALMEHGTRRRITTLERKLKDMTHG